MVLLDLDELPHVFDGIAGWSARRPALARFRRADHIGDPTRPLAYVIRELVQERTGIRPQGPIRLLTNLRYFGHCFNPVSFYYCYDERGERVEAVVAEVTNTPWGERHAYVLGAERESSILSGKVEKALHVSPLMGMDYTYDWRATTPGEQLVVHIASEREGRCAFDATLSLQRRELEPSVLRRLLLRYPALTLQILAGIYAHALRLRLKGAPYHPRPAVNP